MQKFLRECEEMGLSIATAHVSGHADSNAIETLVQRTNPAVIMPIHTENAAWFKNKYTGLQVCERGFLKLT
jgi:mRNA degradation ribonuclease J1/J2